MGLGGVAIAVLPSVVHLQLTFSDRLGGVSVNAILVNWLYTVDFNEINNGIHKKKYMSLNISYILNYVAL